MGWTNVTPTTDGYYWLTCTDWEPQVVRVSADAKRLDVFGVGEWEMSEFRRLTPKAQWAGPIPQPA